MYAGLFRFFKIKKSKIIIRKEALLLFILSQLKQKTIITIDNLQTTCQCKSTQIIPFLEKYPQNKIRVDFFFLFFGNGLVEFVEIWSQCLRGRILENFFLLTIRYKVCYIFSSQEHFTEGIRDLFFRLNPFIELSLKSSNM